VLAPLVLAAVCAAALAIAVGLAARSADSGALGSTGSVPSATVVTGSSSQTAAATLADAAATPSVTATPSAAEVGRNAASQRLTFAPQRIRLVSQGGVSAAVQRVDTGPGGVLELPADPGVTGWWVSGALAGEVYGSVVLAGHIDSRERGVGFFAQLLDAAPGDRIELSGGGLGQAYVVRSNAEVDKDALSTGTDIFDRTVKGRLVLLTCTGTFDPRTRHYDHNLVVIADPVGPPHRLAG
jgi:sortase family protein